jgi:hypothetical protein
MIFSLNISMVIVTKKKIADIYLLTGKDKNSRSQSNYIFKPARIQLKLTVTKKVTGKLYAEPYTIHEP